MMEARELKPHKSGLQSIRITAEDRKLGYMLVKDWMGHEHRIEFRNSEDYVRLPVPKPTNSNQKP